MRIISPAGCLIWRIPFPAIFGTSIFLTMDSAYLFGSPARDIARFTMPAANVDVEYISSGMYQSVSSDWVVIWFIFRLVGFLCAMCAFGEMSHRSYLTESAAETFIAAGDPNHVRRR